MKINGDFAARAAVHAGRIDWIPSPMLGVARKMLDRIGAEVARATTIVRYDPGSRFSPHTHDGGEEFLVLDGVFEDEHGAYPAGTYVRNPPGSRHRPGAADGCTIFVKLWQFDPQDRQRHVVDTGALDLEPMAGRPGVAGRVIHEDVRECVRIERWAPGARVEMTAQGGVEILCLEGGFDEGGERFAPASWLRLPAGAMLSAVSGAQGCRLWLKEGHLRLPITAPVSEAGHDR
jgi:quercetin dioxygenase-like cupin family protein